MPKYQKRRSTQPFILMGAGLLLIIAAIASVFSSSTNTPPAASPTTVVSSENTSDVERVSPEDAYTAHQNGQAVFVDVRGAQEYAQKHIVGAVSIPLLELPDRIAELDPDDWIITY